MMTMSKALSAGQAKDYYQQEFISAKENYYSESGEVRGQWYGRLAEEWGLKGEVGSEQYERLVAGQDPHTGEQLVRPVKSREEVNRYGDEITTSEHRAGWDATLLYRVNLADRLQKLGYEIEVDARTGAPEIKGFSKEYLQESSPRSAELRKEAAAMKERLEQQGITVKEGAGLNQAAARNDRASKNYDRDEMRERALELDGKHENQAAKAVGQARERGSINYSQDDITKRAQEAVTFARDNATEREAVTDMRKVMADALRRNIGLTTYEAVATELRQRVERGEFVEIIRERKPREATTQRMLEMEKSNIQTMLDGQGQHIPIIGNDARQTVDAIAERQQLKLNENQRTAVEEILTSRDQIIGL